MGSAGSKDVSSNIKKTLDDINKSSKFRVDNNVETFVIDGNNYNKIIILIIFIILGIFMYRYSFKYLRQYSSR